MSASFVQLPPRSVVCRYAPQPGGGVAVVTVGGQVLAPSFFELRHRFSFVCSVAGSGSWVVLQPIAPQPQQPALI